ncbi:Leucine-rich repeat-containing protein 1 [Balamuthia mandrillaris]
MQQQEDAQQEEAASHRTPSLPPQPTCLDLNDCMLRQLPDELSVGTQGPALVELDAFRNQLTELQPHVLSCLTSLTECNFTRNQLRSLPPELGRLTNLIKCFFGFNELSSLPKEFGQLTKLTACYFHYNQLTSLPAEFGRLSALTICELSNNQLACLPQEFGQLHNLTKCYLQHNQLSALPKTMGKLASSLASLHLHHNRFSKLPKALCELSSLVELSLHHNQLTSLPQQFGLHLPSLTVLDLSDNNLTALPKAFGNLGCLSSCNLSTNQLQALPQEFARLTALRRCNLKENFRLMGLPPQLYAAFKPFIHQFGVDMPLASPPDSKWRQHYECKQKEENERKEAEKRHVLRLFWLCADVVVRRNFVALQPLGPLTFSFLPREERKVGEQQETDPQWALLPEEVLAKIARYRRRCDVCERHYVEHQKNRKWVRWHWDGNMRLWWEDLFCCL